MRADSTRSRQHATAGARRVPSGTIPAAHDKEIPMADSIFGKIIRGEIPSHKVYEDADVLAFLDINPLSRGHTLVIPKEPAETLDQLSDASAAALGRVLPRICRAVMAATGVREYNVLENNGGGAHQVVPHVHFHIIPKPNAQEGLGVGWPAGKLASDAVELAAKIKAAAK
jgi:histidine triad (HIT) family protein